MKNFLFNFLAVLSLSTAVGGYAYSAPVIGPTGNAYEYIPASSITWASAQSATSTRTYLGMPGHLTTIFNQAENDFVLGLLAGVDGSIWLGGSDAANEGSWTWVTGEQFWQGNFSGTTGPDVYYANWINRIEPNNVGGGEDFLTMFGPLVRGAGNSAPGLWNDLSPLTMATISDSDFYIHGYVVEYETSAVPIPSALWLLLSGFLVLASMHIKRIA